MDQRHCLSCQSKKLVNGSLGVHRHTFVPMGRTMFLGYSVKACVCLDCGFVGQYLDPDDLQDIQLKQKS
ncbi:hypothetical protein [Leptolyngbya sp. GGD]|uniref:hypothetical protein n=1 Tax=Leptolyngbya sp. GGD TaxID=2997907 RepID=UPI00227D3F69|nr:hypothetical protein [Leptolyngbya sp. GGD]MCY6489257.1 hypothetical protein [Leptolyngbya sp. GGD]